MIDRRSYLWVLLVALLWGGTSVRPAMAQDAPEAGNTVDPEKAREEKRSIRQGNKFFANREMVRAAEAYEKAFNINPNSFNLSYRLARAKWFAEDVDMAIQYYDHAKVVDPDGNDTLYYDLATALKKQGKYEAAKAQYTEFLKRHKFDGYLTKQAKFEIEGIDAAIQIMGEPPKYRMITVPFNSTENDYSTTLWTVETDSFLVFTSHRPGTRGKKNYPWTGEPYSDVWVVSMDSDTTYGSPEVLGKKKINTKANDGAAYIDPEGKKMYYTICGNGKIGRKWGCSIYYSEYNADKNKWSKFKPIQGINGKREQVVKSNGKVKQVPTDDKQPYVTADGQTMYFASNRPGGSGGHDIWYSKKNGDVWSEPVNCGPKVNTEFDEIWPYLGQDSESMYFASTGHKGLGGMDMWQVKGSEANWSTPENMGYPLNTSYDDYALVWVYQDSVGYLSSDRTESIGRDDIFTMHKEYKPQYPITIHGIVRDKKTKQVIPFATVVIYKTEGGKFIALDTFKTQQNARYEFTLERGFDYKLVGSAPEYLSGEAFASTQEVDNSKGPVDLEQDIDIYLDRIEFNRPYALENIYYDFDKADLRQESIDELEKLVRLLEDNPTLVIQIGSHTDTNGSERYNIRLSDRRARSVVKYLTKERAVPSARVVAFGFGETQPMMYPELSDSDEQANRRTEFRIRSFEYKTKK